MGGFGKDLADIAALLIGLALVSMLIARSSNTAEVITAGGDAFGKLLSTATFQNGGGYANF
jgi:hypothetical protein